MFLRVLTVLTASTAGLAAASLIYYSLLQDGMIHRGGLYAILWGRLLSLGAILWFIFSVFQLYLNFLPAMVISGIGMMVTKLLWDMGDGYRYAGRIYMALIALPDNTGPTEDFLQASSSHRQTQDLRAVALTMFAPDSRQMTILENLISGQR